MPSESGMERFRQMPLEARLWAGAFIGELTIFASTVIIAATQNHDPGYSQILAGGAFVGAVYAGVRHRMALSESSSDISQPPNNL